MSTIRVLLVDSHPDFIKAATSFLMTEPRLILVGCANSGQEAMRQTVRLQPDLILIDINMLNINNYQNGTSLNMGVTPAPCIIILAAGNDPEYLQAARRHHFDGFVTKSEFGTKLLPLIYRLFDEPHSDLL